jgi:prevent-host-death family protein
MNNIWQVQDAKARFSELLNSCKRDGPQVVTRRGMEEAVLVPIQEWIKLKESNAPTLKALLLSNESRFDFEVPKRGQGARRKPLSF